MLRPHDRDPDMTLDKRLTNTFFRHCRCSTQSLGFRDIQRLVSAMESQMVLRSVGVYGTIWRCVHDCDWCHTIPWIHFDYTQASIFKSAGNTKASILVMLQAICWWDWLSGLFKVVSICLLPSSVCYQVTVLHDSSWCFGVLHQLGGQSGLCTLETCTSIRCNHRRGTSLSTFSLLIPRQENVLKGVGRPPVHFHKKMYWHKGDVFLLYLLGGGRGGGFWDKKNVLNGRGGPLLTFFFCGFPAPPPSGTHVGGVPSTFSTLPPPPEKCTLHFGRSPPKNHG